MEMYLATFGWLLWGISVLFSVESISVSIPVTSSVDSSTEPSKTTQQLMSTENVAHNETATQPETGHPTHQPAEDGAATTVETKVAPSLETEKVSVTYTVTLNDNVTGLVAMSAVATTTRLLHTSTAVITAAGETQPSHNATISETAKPTRDQFHQQSPTTSTDMTSSPATAYATSPAATLATETVSSPQPTSAATPEVTSNLSPTTSPTNSTQTPVFVENLNGPSSTAASKMTENPTSEAAPVSDPTFPPITINKTSTTSTELSSMSQPVSVTRTHISTSAGSSSTAEPSTISFLTDSANTTTAAVSTNATGVIIPRVPKRLPIQTTTPTPASTIEPREVSKSPVSNEVKPCSNRRLTMQCLIAIASLAVLATVFMVSTIILCAKLSARKYKVKRHQPATEMMCISALLPEPTYNYMRQRNRVHNGVRVMHGCGDSDEDVGDNLTLSSFLPEGSVV